MASIQVDYIDHMGTDLTVVNAARVSFDQESTFEGGEDGDLSNRDEKLINYLATHNHWTPFSHPQITLRETVPIFIARQRFKHMVGFTYNEVSRRYVDSGIEFYSPDEWRSRPEGSVKQGSGDVLDNKDIPEYYECLVAHCEFAYEDLLDMGVAPEQARMVLPQSMMTSYYVTGSLAAFTRLYKQRIDPHAQKEIQDLAEKIGDVIEPLFPVSWAALTK